jgi:tRNA(fMet)-specific endonuclease VapC
MRYVPRGVAAVISPWNFPLAIPTGMVAAALAAGNGTLLKPAEQSPATALALVEALRAAGVPADAIGLLPGYGEVGAALVVLRGRLDLESMRERNDDICIAAITAAELLTGVERADEAHRSARQEFTEGIFALVPVEDYTLEVARVHARLLAHVRREGQPRGAHDLIIAATAAATARKVMTADAKARFADLPGVATMNAV